MIKSVFLFFLWFNNIYFGSAAVAVAQNLATRLPMVAECRVVSPTGWVPYTVRSTDALVELANRTGVTIEELVAVNCLAAPGVTKALLVLAPKALAPIIPTNAVTAQPSVPITTALPEIVITPMLTVTTVTTTPAPPTALSVTLA